MKQFVSKVNKCNLFNIISSNSTFTSTSSNRREDYSQEEFLVCRLVFLMDSQSSGEYLLNTFHSWNKLNFQLGWIWCFAWRPSQDILFQYKVNSGNINPTINVYILRRRGETFVNICHFIRKEMLFTWFNSQHS